MSKSAEYAAVIEQWTQLESVSFEDWWENTADASEKTAANYEELRKIAWRAWMARAEEQKPKPPPLCVPSIHNLTRYCEYAYTMEPDVYDGKSCDQVKPQWTTEYPKEGKEVVGENLKMELEAKQFPPGTRVEFHIPCCPECGEMATQTEPRRYGRTWPRCRCGFSWKKWTEEQYS